MVGPSQKNLFWALEKWKIDFSCKENKNSLCQYCLPIQNANFVQNMVSFEKYLINPLKNTHFKLSKNEKGSFHEKIYL